MLGQQVDPAAGIIMCLLAVYTCLQLDNFPLFLSGTRELKKILKKEKVLVKP